MNRSLLFFFLLISFARCAPEVPANVLPPAKMQAVFWDLMRADAYVSTFITKDSTKNQKTESAILYEKIFDIHSTTQEAFKKSLAFYQDRPDLFKAISDSLRIDERKTLEPQELKKPDLDTTDRKMKLNKRLIEKKP